MSRYDADAMGEKIEVMRAEMRFPNLNGSTDISRVMDDCNNFQNLQKLDPIRLHEYGVSLAAYGLYLAHETNRLQAKIKWCESNIMHIVGKTCGDLGHMFYTEKAAVIRSTNQMAIDLDEIKLEAQTKYETLNFLSQKIQFLSESVQNLARAKSYESRSHNM